MASGWKYENENAAYKCCFCFHVRTGTLILGLITLLLQGVVLSTFIVAMTHPQMLAKPMPSDVMGISTTMLPSDTMDTKTNNPLLYYVMTTNGENLVIAVMMTTFLMIITACLIYGTVRGNHKLLIPFMSIQIFDACVTGLAMIGHAATGADLRRWIQSQHFFICKEMLLKMDDNQLMLWALIVFVSSMSLQIYLISVVWACYTYLKERTRQNQYGRRYSEVDVCNGDTEMLLPPKYEDVITLPSPAPPGYTPN